MMSPPALPCVDYGPSPARPSARVQGLSPVVLLSVPARRLSRAPPQCPSLLLRWQRGPERPSRPVQPGGVVDGHSTTNYQRRSEKMSDRADVSQASGLNAGDWKEPIPRLSRRAFLATPTLAGLSIAVTALPGQA